MIALILHISRKDRMQTPLKKQLIPVKLLNKDLATLLQGPK
jgi:hypothetical protein